MRRCVARLPIKCVSYRAKKYTPLLVGSAIEVELCIHSLVVVRCCVIVCLVSLIGPPIRIFDNGRHDADKVQLFHGVIGDGCRQLNRKLYKR